MYKPTDYVQQLAAYIQSNLAKGYTLDALKFSLMKQGYSRITVEKAIERANMQLAQKAPMIKERPQITYKVVDDNEGSVTFLNTYKKSFWKRIFDWFKN